VARSGALANMVKHRQSEGNEDVIEEAEEVYALEEVME
jgi:hypothetical protein